MYRVNLLENEPLGQGVLATAHSKGEGFPASFKGEGFPAGWWTTFSKEHMEDGWVSLPLDEHPEVSLLFYRMMLDSSQQSEHQLSLMMTPTDDERFMAVLVHGQPVCLTQGFEVTGHVYDGDDALVIPVLHPVEAPHKDDLYNLRVEEVDEVFVKQALGSKQ